MNENQSFPHSNSNTIHQQLGRVLTFPFVLEQNIDILESLAHSPNSFSHRQQQEQPTVEA